MTEIKLIQLISKVEKKEIEIYDVIKLKDFTDEEIDLILQTKHKKEIMELMNNTDFRSQPLEIQQKIIEIIDNYESTTDSLYYATKIAKDKNVINSGYIEEIIEIIIQLKEFEKIYIIERIIKNPIAITNKDIMKIIKMIANSSKNENILRIAESIIESEYIYCNLLEKVELILNCQTEEEARALYNEELEKSLLINSLNALDEEKIDEINFWQLLKEDYSVASKLLIYSTFEKSFIEKINGFEIKEYEELMSKYTLENIEELINDLEKKLPSNIKIKRKTKERNKNIKQ